jgi:hypothetical protein
LTFAALLAWGQPRRAAQFVLPGPVMAMRLLALFTDADFLVQLGAVGAGRRQRPGAGQHAWRRSTGCCARRQPSWFVPVDRLGDPGRDLVHPGHGSIIFVQVAI